MTNLAYDRTYFQNSFCLSEKNIVTPVFEFSHDALQSKFVLVVISSNRCDVLSSVNIFRIFEDIRIRIFNIVLLLPVYSRQFRHKILRTVFSYSLDRSLQRSRNGFISTLTLDNRTATHTAPKFTIKHPIERE